MSSTGESSGKYQAYMKEHKIFVSEPLIQNFLQEVRNQQLLLEIICSPTPENEKEFENAFREFYADIRLNFYISTVIYRHAIYFDKRQRERNIRYQLILDQPISNTNIVDNLVNSVSSKITLEQTALTEENFKLEDIIESSALFKAMKPLTPLQRSIIEMAYIQDLTDKRIAEKLGSTRQAVTKTRNKALINIKAYFNKGV